MEEFKSTEQTSEILITDQSVRPINELTWEQLKLLLKAGYNPRMSGDGALKEQQDPDAILAGSGGAFALIPSFPYNVRKLANMGKIIAPDNEKLERYAPTDTHAYLYYILSHYVNDGEIHNGESWAKFESDLELLIKDEEHRGTLCRRITEGLFACFNDALRLIDHNGFPNAVIWMARADNMTCYDLKEYHEIGKLGSTQKIFWRQRYVLFNFKEKFGYQSAVEFLLGATVKMAEKITSPLVW